MYKALLLGWAFYLVGMISGYTQPTPTDFSSQTDGLRSYTSQLYMEVNQGQWSSEIQAQSFTEGKQIRFLENGLSIAMVRSLPKISKSKQKRRKDLNLVWMGETDPDYEALVWNLSFKGGQGRLLLEEEIPGYIHYFQGNDPSKWTRNVSRFRQLWYKDVYPGIDIRYYGTGEEDLKYDVVLAPKADIQLVKIEASGIEMLRMDTNGDLLIQTEWGPLTEARPFAYQWINGREVPINVSYKIIDNQTFGYEINGTYDPNSPLIIDPLTLSWGTFMHSAASDDYATGVSKDSLGNIILTGYTKTLSFPTTIGVYQNNFGGNIDVFVAKLNPTGTNILWASYLGGSQWELSYGVGLNEAQEVYLSGYCLSTNFPTTTGAHTTSAPGGVVDAFLAKLSPNGDSLKYSTYIGGTDRDYLYDLYVAPEGEAYVTGMTFSTDFPVSSSYIQNSALGGGDVFVSKYSNDGATLEYSTYIGGNSFDIGNGIVVNEEGEAFIAGQTGSSDFPSTSGAFQTTPAFSGSIIAEDAFVIKLDSLGSQMEYATFLGGQNSDVAYDIVINNSDEAFITGVTYSNNFPTTLTSFQSTFDGTGMGDAFMARLSSNGQQLIASSYLGGTDQEYAKAIGLNDQNEVFIVGSTRSTDFPATDGSANYGGFDAFVAVMSETGALLSQASYLGGSQNDYPRSAASMWVDGSDAALAITTHSPDALTTSGTYQPTKTNSLEDTPWVLSVTADAILDLTSIEMELAWEKPLQSAKISWPASAGYAVQVQRQDQWGGWMNVSPWIQNQLSYTDASFHVGSPLTYRIKWIDGEDHYRYSDPQTLVLEQNFEVYISPNPADDNFELVSPWPWQRVSVYDVAGHIMSQQTGEAIRELTFDTEAWPSGVYFCEFQSAEGRRFVKKIVISH